jgi:hypothetical protein
VQNPSYIIFRKSFCLLKGFSQAKMSFQVHADDTVQLFLNSQLNQVLPPSGGNWNGPPLSGGTTNQAYFHGGENRLYALVEDTGGHLGFDLVGSVSANGLLPIAGAGTDGSFEPCSCRSGPAGVANGAKAALDEEQLVINEIVKIAEARRARKQKIE